MSCVACCCFWVAASCACIASESSLSGEMGSMVMAQLVPAGTAEPPVTKGSVDFGPTTMKGIDGSAFWPFGLPAMMVKSSNICVQSPREKLPPVPPPGWKNQWSKSSVCANVSQSG